MRKLDVSPMSRWPLPRRQAVVLDLLSGRDTLAGLAHRYRLDVSTILEWKVAFLEPRGSRLL
jgi:hypothetical protein